MANDWDPEKYAEFQAERELPFHDLLAKVTPVPGGRGIDLGCGPGRLTAVMHEKLGLEETLGVDSSPAMIRASGDYEGPGRGFELGDIADVDRLLPGGPYDVVLSNAALQWLPDHGELLARLARLLGPRGQLAVQVPANFDHPSHVLARDLSRRPPWSDLLAGGERPPSVLAPEEYARILHGIGLDDLDVTLHVYAHVLPSGRSVVDWVQGTLLLWYRQRLPEEDWPTFLAEYTSLVEEALPGDDPYLFTFKRILFTARRPA